LFLCGGLGESATHVRKHTETTFEIKQRKVTPNYDSILQL
jgi:hypothetical protein